ncbi:MAG: hypothetical protein ACE5I1_08355 [bacterium]
MALKKPFVTERFIAYSGDTTTTRLSLVIQLVDEFTLQAPAGNVRITLQGARRLQPIKNLSGFVCFTDLPDGPYTIVTEPDRVRADWYLPVVNQTVNLPLPNPKEPLKTIELNPAPSYPFPGNESLIRGIVKTSTGFVEKAEVAANYTGESNPATNESRTDHNGEFVLFFKKSPNLNSNNKIKEMVLTIKKDGTTKSVTVAAFEEGTTANLNVIQFP